MTIHFGKIIELFGGLINERLKRRKSDNSKNSDVLDVLLDTSQENPEEIDRVHIERLCLVCISSFHRLNTHLSRTPLGSELRDQKNLKKNKK